MSDPKKPERIIVDESVFENLFGPPSRKSTPETENPTGVAESPEPSIQPVPARPVVESRADPETISRSSAPAPADLGAAAAVESVDDSGDQGGRTSPLDVQSTPPASELKSGAVMIKTAVPSLTVKAAPAAAEDLEAESQPIPDGRLDDPAFQHAQGNLQFANGEYSRAEESYREVLKMEPDSWSGHFNLGMVLEHLSRHEEALIEYGEARRIDAGRIEAATRSGFVELRLGEHDKALTTFKYVLAAEPKNDHALFGKGSALQCLEMFSEASECYRTLLKSHPDNEELLSNLAATSLALNDPAHALECTEMIAEAPKEPADLLRLRIECAVAQADEETAAQQSAQLVEMVEDSYQAWFNLGVACQHTGRLEVAVDAYKQALAVEPDRWEAQVNLGAVLHESENLAEAREFYEAARESGLADHPGVNWNLGLAAESLGAFDVAENAYANTVQSQPHWKEAVGRLTRLNPSYDPAR